MSPLVRVAAQFGADFSRHHFLLDVPLPEVFGYSKRREYTVARHAGFAWLRSVQNSQGIPLSYPVIARIVRPANPFDHTRIMYGVQAHKRNFPASYFEMFPQEAQIELPLEMAS